MDEMDAQLQPQVILPMIKASVRGSGKPPRVMRPEETPIMEPLVGDLAVGYAFDLPWGYVMVAPGRCKRLGLAQESLRALAVNNLHARAARTCRCAGLLPPDRQCSRSAATWRLGCCCPVSSWTTWSRSSAAS